MILETMCIMMIVGHYDCNWTLGISEGISCNGVPVLGCTYYDTKSIYLKKWDACILWHEITEHAQKKSNVIHYLDCWKNLKEEQKWKAHLRENN